MIKMIVCALTIFMAFNTYAAEFFTDSELKTIQLIKTDPSEGTARLKNKEGLEVEISSGDRIAVENALVTEVNAASITVKMDDMKLKIPIFHGFGENM